MKPVLPFGAYCFFSLLASCQSPPEPVCQSTTLVPISKAVGPRTAAVRQTVTYHLRYVLGNTCASFSQFVLNADTTTAGIYRQAGVSALAVGCSCASTDTTSTPTTYQFQPQRAGTYYVQFLTTNNAFITDTLTVR